MFRIKTFYEYYQDYSYTLENDILAIYSIFMVRDIYENNEVKRTYKVLKGDHISIPIEDASDNLLSRLQREGPFTLKKKMDDETVKQIMDKHQTDLSKISLKSLFPES